MPPKPKTEKTTKTTCELYRLRVLFVILNKLHSVYHQGEISSFEGQEGRRERYPYHSKEEGTYLGGVQKAEDVTKETESEIPEEVSAKENEVGSVRDHKTPANYGSGDEEDRRQ